MREFFATLTKPQTIKLIILAMIIASILATIFTLVVILIPNLFPEWVHIRESVITLATCGMVLATLVLAFGTFSIIMHDRERENRDRKERYLNEILRWLRGIEDSIFPLPDIDIYKESLQDKELATKLGVTIDDIRMHRRTQTSITNLNRLRTELKNVEYFKKVAFKLNSAFSELINNILCLLEQRRKLIMETSQYPLDTIEDIRKDIKTGFHILLGDLMKDNTKPLDGLELSEKNINNILMGRNAGDIKESTNKAIEKAVDLKYVI